MLFVFLPLWLYLLWPPGLSFQQLLLASSATLLCTEGGPECIFAAFSFHPYQGDISCPM